MNLNQLDYRVTFYDFANDGPEAGMGGYEPVYSCFSGMFEPTQKDVQLGKLELSKRSVTLNIRDEHPKFIPTVNKKFEITYGKFIDMFFNVIIVVTYI